MGSGQQDLLRNTSKGESYIDCVAMRFLSRISFMESGGVKIKECCFCFFAALFRKKEELPSFPDLWC